MLQVSFAFPQTLLFPFRFPSQYPRTRCVFRARTDRSLILLISLSLSLSLRASLVYYLRTSLSLSLLYQPSLVLALVAYPLRFTRSSLTHCSTLTATGLVAAFTFSRGEHGACVSSSRCHCEHRQPQHQRPRAAGFFHCVGACVSAFSGSGVYVHVPLHVYVRRKSRGCVREHAYETSSKSSISDRQWR